MSTAVSIVFARDDLSIPGGSEETTAADPATVKAHFFALTRNANPDVIVLDFENAQTDGVETILEIRRETTIPILIICRPDADAIEEYRIAGAAGCIAAPIDFTLLNRAIQRVIEVTRRARPPMVRNGAALDFAGMRFYATRNLLTRNGASSCELTATESRTLEYFLTNPWELCTRGELGKAVHGEPDAVGERAVDVVVNRLRKKLVLMAGAEAEYLIKTEFRRGYRLVTDVCTAMEPSGPVIYGFDGAG